MIKLKDILKEVIDDDYLALMYEIRELETQLKTDFPQLETLSLVMRARDNLFVNQIRIRAKDRGKGYGSVIMRIIADFAKKHNMHVTLFPYADNPKKYKDKLIKFYKGLGYKLNRGKNRFPQYAHPTMTTMVKEPKEGINEVSDDFDVFANAPKPIPNSFIANFNQMQDYQDTLDLGHWITIESDDENIVHMTTGVPTYLHYTDKRSFYVKPEWVIERLLPIFGKKIGRGLMPFGNIIKFNLKELSGRVTLNDYQTGYWDVTMTFPKNAKVTVKLIKELAARIRKATYDISESGDYKWLFQKQFGADWWKYYEG
jgi:GNAT superfamily N-acetyltransferase